MQTIDKTRSPVNDRVNKSSHRASSRSPRPRGGKGAGQEYYRAKTGKTGAGRSCFQRHGLQKSLCLPVFNDREIAILERLKRKQNCPKARFLRVKILLLYRDGLSKSEIARRLGISRTTVRLWCKRWIRALPLLRRRPCTARCSGECSTPGRAGTLSP